MSFCRSDHCLQASGVWECIITFLDPETRARETCFCSNCLQKRKLGSAPGWAWGVCVAGKDVKIPEALAGPRLMVLPGTGFSFSPTARFAEEACALLMSSKFEACHHAVSPLPYLQNCRYDVCSCADGRDCLCSAVANYAAACAGKGVHIGWREPDFCGTRPINTFRNPLKLSWHLVGLRSPVLFKDPFFELFHLETGPNDKPGSIVHLQPFFFLLSAPGWWWRGFLHKSKVGPPLLQSPETSE